METIFEYVRTLPASLLSWGRSSRSPISSPEPKTNLADFAEATPLSLAVLRVPRGESGGERHRKRVQSWEEAPVTLYDLTDGIPSPAGKGKEITPLVVQYVRAVDGEADPGHRARGPGRASNAPGAVGGPGPSRRQGPSEGDVAPIHRDGEHRAPLAETPGPSARAESRALAPGSGYLQAHAGEEPAEEIRASDLPPAPPVRCRTPRSPDSFLPGSSAAVRVLWRPSALARSRWSPCPSRTTRPFGSPGTRYRSGVPRARHRSGSAPSADRSRPDAVFDERLSNVNPVPRPGGRRPSRTSSRNASTPSVEQRMRAIPPPRPPEPIDPLRIDGAVQEHLDPALADQAARQAEALKEPVLPWNNGSRRGPRSNSKR